MLTRLSPFTTFVRCYANPKRWNKDAVKYEYVKYYPKNPQHKDPPITPTKLLMVTLVKPFKGNPYWHKNTIKLLGLAEKGKVPVVVKNTPEVCAMLWEVKHLVKVTPIKLPETLPDWNDLGQTYLQENGNFLVFPKIDPLRIESTEEFINDSKKLESKRVGEKLRLMWLNGNLP